MSKCQQCNTVLKQQATCCFACGAIQSSAKGETVECEQHGGECAVGLCVVCGKPVCGDCAVSVEGRTFCDNAQHQAVFKNWAVVHESDFEFESDMIERNISSAGIETKVFSFRNFLGTLWLPDRRPVRVLVPKTQEQKVAELLQRLRLVNTQEVQGHD